MMFQFQGHSFLRIRKGEVNFNKFEGKEDEEGKEKDEHSPSTRGAYGATRSGSQRNGEYGGPQRREKYGIEK
jgi:hypothetical protein